MFEDMTKEKILSDLLSQAPPDIDTRPGSIYYDAVKGTALVIARMYSDLSIFTNLIYIDSTGGEYLDKKAAEHGLTRNPATQAVYNFSFAGTTPPGGSRFFYDGLFFTMQQAEDNSFILVAEAAGEASNSIEDGTPVFPVNTISGLTSAAFGSIRVYGTDEESDDEFRDRLRRKISGPAENGNKAHYKAWCEEVDGVGRARIIPLWNGPNTVKGVLISPNGTAVSSSIVDEVQNYVDPGSEGLGEGTANLGAHFTAVTATEFPINIVITGISNSSVIADTELKNLIKTAVTAYLKNQALTATDESSCKLYVSNVGAVILSIPDITAYSVLTLNGKTDYVTIDAEKVAIMGTVTINA